MEEYMQRMIKGILFLLPFFISSVMAEIVVVVNPLGPDELTKVQVKKLYLGKVKKLPGGNLVKVYELPKQTRLHKDFHALVTGRTPAQVNAYWSKNIFTGLGKPPEIVSSAQLLRRKIARDKNAIGYLDITDVDDSVKIVYRP